MIDWNSMWLTGGENEQQGSELWLLVYFCHAHVSVWAPTFPWVPAPQQYIWSWLSRQRCRPPPWAHLWCSTDTPGEKKHHRDRLCNLVYCQQNCWLFRKLADTLRVFSHLSYVSIAVTHPHLTAAVGAAVAGRGTRKLQTNNEWRLLFHLSATILWNFILKLRCIWKGNVGKTLTGSIWLQNEYFLYFKYILLKILVRFWLQDLYFYWSIFTVQYLYFYFSKGSEYIFHHLPFKHL